MRELSIREGGMTERAAREICRPRAILEQPIHLRG
jgi:hypothetical protein